MTNNLTNPLEDFITYDSRHGACAHLLARGRFCLKKLISIDQGDCSDCELFERKGASSYTPTPQSKEYSKVQ